MGYTHYWGFKNPPKKKGMAEKVERVYQNAIKQCQKICFEYNQKLESGDYDRLSGYSAYSKPGKYGGIKVNGSKEYAHEDFVLREHFSQNESDFCKTARKPYDIVVVACLIILKHRLGEYFEVDSDGDASDWVDGLELAKEILELKRLDIPKSIRRDLKIVS